MLIDTHCHLDFPDFQDELDSIVSRAREAGVERIITIGTTLASSHQAIQLSETYPEIFAAIGVHPCHVDSWTDSCADQLAELSRHPKVVAIGETGLDYHHMPAPEEFADEDEYQNRLESIKALQKRAFTAQCQVAEREGLNLVVHQRNSWDDCLENLQPFHGRLGAVFHCFSESTGRARQLIELGHLVSFTGIVTFKKCDALRQTVADLPADRFMLETDAPYLAPVPHRGKRCEPAMVADSGRVIADACGIPLDELIATTANTAKGFFRFS